MRRRRQNPRGKHRLGRLPRETPLGRGYVVKVFLVTPTQIRELLDEEDGDELEGTSGTVAFWDTDQQSIFVDSTVSRQRQWAGYFHELVHAVHDIAELNRGGV